MKHKTRFIIAAASFLMLSACTSVDSLIDQMEKASKEGDVEKLEKIGEKIKRKTNNGEDLTPSQSSRIMSIGLKSASDLAGSFGSSLFDYDDEE